MEALFDTTPSKMIHGKQKPKQTTPPNPMPGGVSELEKMCEAYTKDRKKLLVVDYPYKDGKRYTASLPLEDLRGTAHVIEIFARFTSFGNKCAERVASRFPDVPLLKAQARGNIVFQIGFVSLPDIVFCWAHHPSQELNGNGNRVAWT